MGATNYEFYSDDLINTADLLKSIAHPARLKALLMIANEADRDITMEEISGQIGLSRSTLSAHMKKLSDSGLLKTTVTPVIGRSYICYRVNHIALNYLRELFDHLHVKANAKNDERHESFKRFYSSLKSTIGWNSCFVT